MNKAGFKTTKIYINGDGNAFNMFVRPGGYIRLFKLLVYKTTPSGTFKDQRGGRSAGKCII